jgi:hypothetical protein
MKSTAIFWRSALMLALTGLASAGPLRLTTGLTGINVHEVTGTVSLYSVTASSAGIGSPNSFTTIASESFSVFFSNALGVANPDGEFLTVSCYFAGPGGGCNFAGIELVTSGGNLLANVLASFRSGNDGGYIPGSELNAVDSSLSTFSTLGSDGETNMRLTVAFNGSSGNEVPEPATYALIGIALTGGALIRKRRK